MINIEYLGLPKDVFLTLNEKALCLDPQISAWVFQTVNQQTGIERIFTAPDFLINTGSRFNGFSLISVQTGAEDYQNGTVDWPQAGTYDYTVYQFAVTVPQDLNLANALCVVERGLMRLTIPASKLPSYGVGATYPAYQ